MPKNNTLAAAEAAAIVQADEHRQHLADAQALTQRLRETEASAVAEVERIEGDYTGEHSAASYAFALAAVKLSGIHLAAAEAAAVRGAANLPNTCKTVADTIAPALAEAFPEYPTVSTFLRTAEVAAPTLLVTQTGPTTESRAGTVGADVTLTLHRTRAWRALDAERVYSALAVAHIRVNGGSVLTFARRDDVEVDEIKMTVLSVAPGLPVITSPLPDDLDAHFRRMLGGLPLAAAERFNASDGRSAKGSVGILNHGETTTFTAGHEDFRAGAVRLVNVEHGEDGVRRVTLDFGVIHGGRDGAGREAALAEVAAEQMSVMLPGVGRVEAASVIFLDQRDWGQAATHAIRVVAVAKTDDPAAPARAAKPAAKSVPSPRDPINRREAEGHPGALPTGRAGE